MNKHIAWFSKNASFIKREAVEKELGMPKTTLNQWVLGKRELPQKWIEPLTNWVKQFKK